MELRTRGIWVIAVFLMVACGSQEQLDTETQRPSATMTATVETTSTATTQVSKTAKVEESERSTPAVTRLHTEPTQTPEPTSTSTLIASSTLSAEELLNTPESVPTHIRPSPTPTPKPTVVPNPHGATSPPPPPAPGQVNGLGLGSFLIWPGGAEQNIRDIYDRGQDMGRDPRAFSRLGPSLVATDHFLFGYDTVNYNLGVYEYLQPAVVWYAGSFGRIGAAARQALTAPGMFDPMWADKSVCQANEPPVDCELRIHNPSLILISMGSNDVKSVDEFDQYMRQLLTHLIERGVIPVLVTKADRHEGEDNRNNNVVHQLAEEFRVPLWDFDIQANTLPERGMRADGVHLTFYDVYDYTQPRAYLLGYGVYNLSALMVLDAIWHQLF